MKILINTSTINQGGAVQVAINLIKYTLADSTHEYFYIISKVIHESSLLKFNDNNILLAPDSPAGIFSYKTKNLIVKYEKSINPDIVYSVGAPSYVKFKAIEVLRMTNPWLFNRNPLALSTFGLKARLRILLKIKLMQKYISTSHYFITQTQDAKNKISNNLKIDKKHIVVIPNTVSEIFLQDTNQIENSIFTILLLAAPYPHKNLSIAPLVAKKLREYGFKNFKFILTYPKEVNNFEIRRLNKHISLNGLENHFENIGRVQYSECVDLYKKANLVFLPTLLETFSVTLLEAMAMKVPLVTTNMSFNREVCGDAALYFKPKDELDAAEKILSIANNEKLAKTLIAKGLSVVNNLPKASDIYKMHISSLEMIADNAKKRTKKIK